MQVEYRNVKKNFFQDFISLLQSLKVHLSRQGFYETIKFILGWAGGPGGGQLIVRAE